MVEGVREQRPAGPRVPVLKRCVAEFKYRVRRYDQLAAAACEDGRAVGETCPVLLAPAGRRASDAAGVRGDSAADLGAAVTVGVSGPLRSGRGTAHFSWVLAQLPATRCKDLVAIEAIAVTLSSFQGQNGNSGSYNQGFRIPVCLGEPMANDPIRHETDCGTRF